MTETTVKISGMMCGMCEAHINDAVRLAFNPKKVTSSRRSGETVVISAQPLDGAKLAEVIKNTGYDLKGIESFDEGEAPEKEKKHFGHFHRKKQQI